MRAIILLSILLNVVADFRAQQLDIEGKARISEMDITITSKSNVVVEPDGTLALRRYAIGDFAHGGIVFWVDETGEHGLVCDANDISSSSIWIGDTMNVTNATGDGKGAGIMNTILIILQHNLTNPSGDIAALRCSNRISSLYGDWYLPSKEELDLMYGNLSGSLVGNFVADLYWSSSESGVTTAWAQDFNLGIQFSINKLSGSRVRAIRRF